MLAAMTDIDQLQASLATMMEKLTAQMTQNTAQMIQSIIDQDQQSNKLMEQLTEQDQKSNNFQEELKVSVRGLFTEEAAVQRTAITEQFRVQAERVTNLEANLASMLVSVKAIQGEDEPHIMKMLEYENVQDIEPAEM